MFRFLLFVLFIWMPWLAAVDEQLQMIKAQAEYAVGNAADAFSRYQVLLLQSRPSWQRAILLYNMGCALVAQGQFTEAIALFKTVPLDQAANPLLADHLYRMMVWSYWQQGMHQMQLQDVSSAIAALQTSLATITQAEQATCALHQAQGSSCQPVYEEWRRLIQQTLQSIKEHPVANMPIPSAAPPSQENATQVQNEKKNVVLKTVLQMEKEDAAPRKSQRVKKVEQRPW